MDARATAQDEFNRSGPVLHLLLRYTRALITQMAQTAVRNYKRGHITVRDRPGLEQRTCECYAVVKKEYDRLLPVKMAQ